MPAYHTDSHSRQSTLSTSERPRHFLGVAGAGEDESAVAIPSQSVEDEGQRGLAQTTGLASLSPVVSCSSIGSEGSLEADGDVETSFNGTPPRSRVEEEDGCQEKSGVRPLRELSAGSSSGWENLDGTQAQQQPRHHLDSWDMLGAISMADPRGTLHGDGSGNGPEGDFGEEDRRVGGKQQWGSLQVALPAGLSSEDADMLMKGAKFLKHGRFTTRQTRFVSLSSDLRQILWRPTNSLLAQALPLSSFQSVNSGFQNRKDQSLVALVGKPGQKSLFLDYVDSATSVDNVNQAHQWAQALQLCLNQVNGQPEVSSI